MNPIRFFNALKKTAKIGLLAGAAAILLLTAMSLWWALAPREQLLFGGLKQADAAEIVAALDEWKVPYSIVEDGTGIAVPEDMVYTLRMRLVSSGVPKGGHVGFELFDDSDFGVTEFAQRVNFQRALQGEIERTIAGLPGVENARVHLTIRRPGLFVGDQEASKASVALTLRPGHSLSRAQVRGIRGLVSAAVEGLPVDRVTVLDSDGAVLAGGGSGGPTAGYGMRDDEEAEIEARIQQRISELLGQVLDNGEFRVSVDAELNFDNVREVNERPIGREAGVVVARRRVGAQDSERTDGAAPGEDIEYAHGTAREEIVRAPGRIQRLSIAAILPPALSEQEVERIQSLIAVAAGIDEARGDRLEVSRLGRDPDTEQVAARTGDTVADRADEDAVGAREAWRFDPTQAAIFATLGLLMGVIAAVALLRSRSRLPQAEREAMLETLRGWLADGSQPS